jgi:hypothetical protein
MVAELSDLFTDVFLEGCRLPTACDRDYEGLWAVAETLAAESGCRRSDRIDATTMVAVIWTSVR